MAQSNIYIQSRKHSAGRLPSSAGLVACATVLAGANVDRYVFADNVYLTPSAHRQFGTYAVDKVRLRW